MIFRHILVVGGTGMHCGVTSQFIEKGHIVSVLARNEKRLKNLKRDYPIKKGRIWTISQGYHEFEQIRKNPFLHYRSLGAKT